MFIVTSTEAHCMFVPHSEAEELVSEKEEMTYPDLDPPGYFQIYLHGKAQDIAGFDIPSYLGGELPAVTGEHPCVLRMPDEDHRCILFLWELGPRTIHFIYAGDQERTEFRGLICHEHDFDSHDYARRCIAKLKEIL